MKFVFASLPLITGFILDCLIGDPYDLPHPVRLIGNLIAGTKKFVRKKFKDLFRGGVFLVITVVLLTALVSAFVLLGAYSLHPVAGVIAESIMIFYLLAARNLRDESMKVFRAADAGDTEGARKAVSMIVGRDTSKLDRDGIVRAAVETVAENTSDGVTAPMFWIAIGGGGAGIPVYRRLYREGIPFAAGVIHKNDVEYPVASALASVVISEKAFEPVSDEAVNRALAVMEKCREVICVTETFGTMNAGNLKLKENLCVPIDNMKK